MFKYLIIILFCIRFSFAQDSINFRPFDSLKTSAEDKHKNVKVDSNNNTVFSNVKKDPNNFDVSLFRSINNSRSNFKDAVLPLIDRSVPPMTFLMPITTMVYGRFSENYYDENSGYLLGVSQGLNLFITFGLKYTIQRKRPYAALDNVFCRETVGTDPYSFPSGHSSIAFTMATLFNLRYPKYPQVYVPMYLYSLIAAYGRPYFGMHYPSDLLGGAIIGAGSSVLVYSLRNHLFRIKNKILSEEKEDAGSINGNTIAIFGGAFIASSILGQFIMGDNEKAKISLIPYGKNNEIVNLNVRIKF